MALTAVDGPLFGPSGCRVPEFSRRADASDLSEWTLSAGWVFPGDSSPIANGRLSAESGRIVDVDAGRAGTHLGGFALLPLPVNLHTHLELSSCREPVGPDLPLTAWIPHVIQHRGYRAGSGIRQGQYEVSEVGTAVAVDILQAEDADDVADAPRTNTEIVSCLECIGLSDERCRETLAAADALLRGTPKLGLSPHAPYSVADELLAGLAGLSQQHGRIITMHVAESPAERVLLESGDGPFRELLESLGAYDVSRLRGRSFEGILDALLSAPRMIVAHGNDLRRSEWQALAGRSSASVAYCPRTHAAFQHERHPVLEMLADGVNVGLGTDSRASNPDLSIWNEVLFLREKRPDIRPEVLLQLATSNGAKALGRDDVGRLAAGSVANALVVWLADPDAADPYEALFGK